MQDYSPVFTALHVMQTRYCDENSVRPSVTRVYCDKTVERSVQFIYHTKEHLA